MQETDIKIYVDNQFGSDSFDIFETGSPRTTAGSQRDPVRTADRAFALLPPTWSGSAEIIFAATGLDYPITTNSVSLGQPVGAGKPLVIRGAYSDQVVYAAKDGAGHEVNITDYVSADQFLGAVLTRVGREDNAPFGPAIAIRGNTAETNSRILLHADFGSVYRHQMFAVQRPGVRLVPNDTLNLTSHDGRSPNLTFIGIEIAPAAGKGLNFLNVRAQFDTCAISLSRELPTVPVTCNVHTNSHLIGGIEDAELSPGLRSFSGENFRAQAGLLVHSSHQADIIWANNGSAMSRHLSFRRITVRASLGGRFSPRTLEALEAPIRIMAGGLGVSITGWGTASNKARIRNVANITGGDPGDGLRVTDGGSIRSVAPLHLDIYGCARDGIHLDGGAEGSFGPVGGNAGLVTTGPVNGRFGMNVRNGSRAFVGADAAIAAIPGGPARSLNGRGALSATDEPIGQIALDDVLVRDLTDSTRLPWDVVLANPRYNTRLSLVCRYE
jgi:hypothetical protein